MNKENAFGTITGTAGITFPWWSTVVDVATGANQLLVGMLGLVVLGLTVRKMWLESQIASRKLRELDRR
jgi:hypothetical protein